MFSSIFQRVVEAQERYQAELLSKANVVGVAVGYRESDGAVTDEPAIVVLVEEKKPIAALSVDDTVPREVNGIRTDVYEVGYLRAQQNPRDRFRPVIPPGVSVGHYKVTAGTLGAMVKDRTTGEPFLLSNNHVFANSNEALKGDAILQPGTADRGKDPEDKVAELERWVSLNYLEGPVGPPNGGTPDPGQPPTDPTNPSAPGCDIVDVLVNLSNALAKMTGSGKRVQSTTASALSVAGPTLAPAPSNLVRSQAAADNTIDAALARPLNPTMFSGDILNIGSIDGAKAAALGMRVRKMGRTTGYTEGSITLMNATVNVAYNTSQGTRTARFTGQVITEAMSQGGDSGSLMVDTGENKAVGLLFAGSNLATIFTPIELILNALNVEF
jgi:hypothetical protein